MRRCNLTAPILLLYGLSATAAAASEPELAPPARLLVCESANDSCVLPNAHYSVEWHFEGRDGSVTTPGGPIGVRLTVERFDGQTIVIRRFDRAGPTAGLSGLYTGTIDASRITGTVKWSWMGHSEVPPRGMWAAIIQPAPVAETNSAISMSGPWTGLPPVLIECEGTGPCNAAWQLSGAEGTATWFGQTPVRAKLSIIRADAEDIRIRRTDTSDGNSAVYYGARHGDQISGTVVWSGPDHPGQNSGTWSASIPQTTCNEQANMTAADSMHIGLNALMFNRQDDALGCYILAAKTGDPTAQTAVGLIYYQGSNGVPQDYTRALYWLRKAADQGVYCAQTTVSEMFTLGQGTPRDELLARFYGEKAAAQKRDWERAQDRTEARRNSANSALTGFVLGAVFGAIFF